MEELTRTVEGTENKWNDYFIIIRKLITSPWKG